MFEKSGKGRGMYAACGLILLAGAMAFGQLMLMAQEVIGMEEALAAHAMGIYLYVAGAAIPCLAALGMLMAVVHEIRRERAFTACTQRLMRGIAWMAFAECGYILAGLFGWSLIGLMHPGATLAALAIVLFGLGVGLLARALSGLIGQASGLREENELTI